MNMRIPDKLAAEGFVPLQLVANPISGDVNEWLVSTKLTLAEIIAQVPNLPDRFHAHGFVTVHQGSKISYVPRKFWAKGQVTAKLWLTGSDAAPVYIRLHNSFGKSGGGSGSKSVLAIVATLALVAVGTFITGGGLAGLLGPAFAAGTFGAQAVAFGVTFLGRLAISMALKPAAASPKSGNEAPQLGQAGASGNTLSIGGTFFYCAGQSKVFPQLASVPLVELVGRDEIVEASYALAGAHQLRNLTVEGTAAGEIDGLSYVVNEAAGQPAQSLLSRYGVQSQPQFELKAHVRSKTNLTLLEHQNFPEVDLPKAHIETTKTDPDEIWMQFLWPTGLTDSANNVDVVMPLRLKLRIAGTDTWINLPEFMFHSNQTGRISKKIVLSWATPPMPILDQVFTNGAWHSFHTVPGQGFDAPIGIGAWAAHASFVGGANYNATARVERREDGFIIYLDPAVFPRGQRWQVWMMRGVWSRINYWAYSNEVFNPVNYGTTTLATRIVSLFGYLAGAGAPKTANNSYYPTTIVDACILMRFASVWNQKPLPLGLDASIEIKGQNINVTQVAVEASAIIKTWDGAAFETQGTSDYAADHFYHILNGVLTSDAVPTQYINVPELGAWRADCVAAARKISAVFDGREWRETLNAVAASGLAQLKEGRLFGVTRQRNTSLLGVPAAQVFTHLNMNNLRCVKSFKKVPDAVLVAFRNRALDWERDELLVIRPGLTRAEVSRIISLDAVGIADVAQIEEYFKLYLNAAYHRDFSFSFQIWFEGLGCEVGDILAINHMTISSLMASARIVEVERNGSNEIIAVTLDAAQEPNDETGLEAILDLTSLENIFAQGVKIGATIVTGLGATTQPISQVSNVSKRITFEVPFINDQVLPEHMVVLGERGHEALRVEVTKIQVGDNLSFNITAVPEAPQIWG